MFHLLIAYQGWSESSGTLGASRVYINEDDPIGSRFYTNGQKDIEAIKKYPALLVSEPGGEGTQFARVAYITNVSFNASVVKFCSLLWFG